jgi:hypothetical protein
MNNKDRRIILLLLFLGTFLSLILCINFFHTEHSLGNSSKTCPACQFQNSTLSTSQIHFFHIPQLAVLDSLKICVISASNQIDPVSPASRSPPAA